MGILRSRWLRITAVVVLVVVLVFFGLTLRLFVFPDLNAPAKSDAIVVLGGTEWGGQEGIKLAQEGYAPTIAFSVGPGMPCGNSIPHRPSERVLCFTPNPNTTQGEARWIAHMAMVHDWHQVIAVMRITQATRARLRIGRCYSGRLIEVGVTPTGLWDWVHGIMYEWGALTKSLVLQRGC